MSVQQQRSQAVRTAGEGGLRRGELPGGPLCACRFEGNPGRQPTESGRPVCIICGRGTRWAAKEAVLQAAAQKRPCSVSGTSRRTPAGKPLRGGETSRRARRVRPLVRHVRLSAVRRAVRPDEGTRAAVNPMDQEKAGYCGLPCKRERRIKKGRPTLFSAQRGNGKWDMDSFSDKKRAETRLFVLFQLSGAEGGI
jgi:hypothetical protein